MVLANTIPMDGKEAGIVGLTEDLREYAKTLELDYIGFSPVDGLDGAPEDRRLRSTLETPEALYP